MHILISNDDGINAPGLIALVRALSKKHELYVVAPKYTQSAVSRKVSLWTPIYVEKRTLPEFPQVWAYAVDGTPVDCVRLALGNLLPVKPDLCVTGINYGYNIGTDTLYSGTAAAAIETAVNGISAVAVSCGAENKGEWMETAGEIASRMAEFYPNHPLPVGAFYNVNVPDIPLSSIKGAKAATLSRIPYDLPYEHTQDENGDPYYITHWTKQPETDPNSDRAAVYSGYVSVSVLTYGHEHNDLIGRIKPGEWERIGGNLCG